MRFILSVSFAVFSAVFSSAALHAADFTRVTPVIDQMLADEARLAKALRAGDATDLRLLSWTNHAASFAIAAKDPPRGGGGEAAALRKAYVTCANAQSTLGMIANNGFNAVTTSVGGESARSDHEAARGGMTFFLAPFHAKRKECAELTGRNLDPSPLEGDATQLMPAFREQIIGTMSNAQQGEIEDFLPVMDAVEFGIALAVKTNSSEPILRLASLYANIHATDARLRDAAGPPVMLAALKECRWAFNHVAEAASYVREGLARSGIRGKSLENALLTLKEYHRAKRDCAAALGLPDKDGRVRLRDDFTLAEQ